jgi:hypothetical protein
MPTYTFTGAFETVLTGLSNGVNAHLRRNDAAGQRVDTGQPDGSTVVAQTGDQISTDEPYVNAWMVNIATGQPDEPPQDGPQIAADSPTHPETPAAPDSPASDQPAAGTTPPVVDDIL